MMMCVSIFAAWLSADECVRWILFSYLNVFNSQPYLEPIIPFMQPPLEMVSLLPVYKLNFCSTKWKTEPLEIWSYLCQFLFALEQSWFYSDLSRGGVYTVCRSAISFCTCCHSTSCPLNINFIRYRFTLLKIRVLFDALRPNPNVLCRPVIWGTTHVSALLTGIFNWSLPSQGLLQLINSEWISLIVATGLSNRSYIVKPKTQGLNAKASQTWIVRVPQKIWLLGRGLYCYR